MVRTRMSTRTRNSSPSDESENRNQNGLNQTLAGQYSSTGHPFELQGTIRDQVQEQFGDVTNQAYRVYDPSLGQGNRASFTR